MLKIMFTTAAALGVVGVSHSLLLPPAQAQRPDQRLLRADANARGIKHYRTIVEQSAFEPSKSAASEEKTEDNQAILREDAYHLDHVSRAAQLLQQKQMDETWPGPQHRYILLNLQRSKSKALRSSP